VEDPALSLPVAPRWAKLVLLSVVVSAVLAMDQGTKVVAQRELATAVETPVTRSDGTIEVRKVWRGTRQVTVVPGLFNLRYVENPAAAFSLLGFLPDHIRGPVLKTVSILAMLLIVVWYWRTREADWLVLGSFSSILGGALGNLVDRIAHGYVIDFIDWYLGVINPAWPHWPTFNIADSAICVGAAGILWRTFKPYQPQPGAQGWPQGDALVESGRGASTGLPPETAP
jgi:signal peptidase II